MDVGSAQVMKFFEDCEDKDDTVSGGMGIVMISRAIAWVFSILASRTFSMLNR